MGLYSEDNNKHEKVNAARKWVILTFCDQTDQRFQENYMYRKVTLHTRSILDQCSILMGKQILISFSIVWLSSLQRHTAFQWVCRWNYSWFHWNCFVLVYRKENSHCENISKFQMSPRTFLQAMRCFFSLKRRKTRRQAKCGSKR